MPEISDSMVGVFFLVAIFVIIIISLSLALLYRQKLKKSKGDTSENQIAITQIREQLTSVTSSMSNLPRSNEVDLISEKMSNIEQNLELLSEDFIMKKQDMDNTVSNMKRDHVEDFSKIEKKILKETTEKILADTTVHINKTSVNKEEFDRLKSRIETLIGVEIDAQRLQHLNNIFGDTERKDVLSWKCKIITHLKGGLAPKAEEDVLINDQISIAQANKFLKELTELGVVEQKKIESYWLNDNFEWLHKYMGDVELLIHRIKQTVRNEKNYEKFIKENLNLIEDGLILESEQYCIDSTASLDNKCIIDLVCMDKNGVKLYLELKYPTAKSTDKFQIVRYREANDKKSPGNNTRFMIIAPTVPSVMQEMLNDDNFEFREIPF